MKKKIKLGLILTLAGLVLVSLSACGGQTAESETQLVEVSRGDLVVSVSADGSLSFLEDRKLTFGTTGTITEINVEEGDWVTQGEVLARLDTTALELALKTAEVDLEIATSSYAELTYPYTYSTFAFDVPTSVAHIGDAQRRLDKALEALEVELSFDQYWEVWQQLTQAQDDLAKAREGLARGYGADVFESGYLPITSFWTLRAAQLQMDKAQLALDKAKNDLEKAVMIAPFDGVIAVADVKEGDSLSAMDYATRTIVEIVDPRSMELDAEVDEIDVPGVKLEQRAIIGVDALPDEQFDGVVTSISPLAVEESGVISYKVKISFDVPEGSGLKAGMSATADIVIDERSSVLLVPDRAIGRDSQGNPVVTVMVDEQIEERSIVTGISDGFQTEIVDGLDEGEVVVIEKRAKPEPSGPGLF
ncbi:MAG: efflux RND transporter periplasmic adaptor subunit [Dehalococcoidia bacterium]|nr:efflux RND transporter periplasmic adaptor subunit [Dehalococcoidia bacterium]